MDKKISPTLLTKYLNGDCSPEERVEVEQWFSSLESGEDDPRLLDVLAADALKQKMLDQIRLRVSLNDGKIGKSRRIVLFTPLRIAAALLMVVLAGATLVLFNQKESLIMVPRFDRALPAMAVLSNTSSTVQQYSLPDGSTINLKPRGTIEYNRQFDGERREVRLVGEAFFNVTRDKSRPFIINAHDVVVTVLGTSFEVTAYEDAREVKVAVRTGKVSVTRQQTNAVAGGPDEVILTPNQEVIYNVVKENFSKQLVAAPQIILARPTLFHMKYDATPVDQIFNVLKENYGIDIVYDKAVVSSCTLTTTMEEEGFYERIEIICRAIGATYEVQDAKVLIKSAGCQESNN